MDKYEYKLKTEQMLELMEDGAYGKAAEIADTIDWRRVRNVTMLTNVSDIYDKNKDYQKSYDVLNIAYHRAEGSRKIVSRLCTLALKTRNVDEAIDYCDDFIQIAPKDPNQYILKYQILRAQRAPIEQQIEALESFKKAEYIEEWAYELAKLYQEAGMTAECLEECDDLILWFSEGKYVYQAMELKMQYKPLTPSQQEKYDHRYEKLSGETAEMPDVESWAEEKKEQPASEAEEVSEVPEQENPDAEKQPASVPEKPKKKIGNTMKLDEALKSLLNLDLGLKGEKDEEPAAESAGTIVEEDENLAELEGVIEEIESVADLKLLNRVKVDPDLEELRPAPLPEESKEENMVETEAVEEKTTETEAVQPEQEVSASEESDQIEGQMSFADLMGDWGMPSENEETEEVPSDKETDDLKAADEVKTGNEQKAPILPEDIQRMIDEIEGVIPMEEREEPEDVSEDLEDEEEIIEEPADAEEDILEDLEAVEGVIVEVQEDIGEEPFVNSGDEEELVEEPEVIEEDASEEWEEDIIEAAEVNEEEPEITEYAEDYSEEVNEVEEPEVKENEKIEAFDWDDEEELILEETDEEEIDEYEEEADEYEDAYEEELDEYADEYEEELDEYADEYEEEADEYEDAYEEETDEYEDAYEEELDEYEDAYEEELDEYEDEYEEETDEYEDAYEEELDEYEDEYEEELDEYEDEYDAEAYDEREIPDEEEEEIDLLAATTPLSRKETAKLIATGKTAPIPVDEISNALSISDTGFIMHARHELKVPNGVKRAGLTEEQKQLFSYFVPVRGMSEQLVDVLEQDKNCTNRRGTSRTGNLLIIGNKGNGKTVLAVDVVKAIQKQRNIRQGKVAIVTGESLNKKRISDIFDKLYGGALIIEKAGRMNEKTVARLNKAMESDTGELLLVLEDQRKPLDRLLSSNREFRRKFTSRLEVPVLINDELVTFGQTYAQENGYRIDEMGILALYSRIDALQREDHAVSIAEVKEVMDEAMEHSQKASAKKLVRRVFGKNTDDADRILLTEKDFNI